MVKKLEKSGKNIWWVIIKGVTLHSLLSGGSTEARKGWKNEMLKRLRRMLKSVKDFANSKITRTFAKFSADNEISSKAKRKLKDLQ